MEENKKDWPLAILVCFFMVLIFLAFFIGNFTASKQADSDLQYFKEKAIWYEDNIGYICANIKDYNNFPKYNFSSINLSKHMGDT